MIGFNHEGGRRGADRSAWRRGYLDLLALGGLEAGDGGVRPPLGMPGLLILSGRWPTSCDSNILIAFSSFISSRLLKPSLPLLPSCSLGINADISSPRINAFATTNSNFQPQQILSPDLSQLCLFFGMVERYRAILLPLFTHRYSRRLGCPKGASWGLVSGTLEVGRVEW